MRALNGCGNHGNAAPPVIPFIEIGSIEIAGHALSPFGVLLATAVIVGIELAMRRGRQLGVDLGELRYFIASIAVFGLIGAHVLDVVFYYPQEILDRPWVLIDISNGLSSFGGFLSAVIGGLFWKYVEVRDGMRMGKVRIPRFAKRVRPLPMLPFTDILFAVFPVSWILGRMGCALVHDHLGIVASAPSWLTVATGPGPVWRFWVVALHFGNQPRYDLGLLEMFFAILLAIGFALTWRRGGMKGWYVVAGCVLYAPVRFALDFFRETATATGDIRYAGLTPAQWGCFLLFAFGVALGIRLLGRRSRRASG